MGLFGSKIGKQEYVEDVQKGILPSTPIATPRSPKMNELLDPRSPSTSIARTPLELYDREILKENETPARNDFLLGIDPRSPSTDFVRTPIVINACNTEYPEKIKNKNLEKVLLSEIYTPSKNKKDTPSNVIPPKLLESSPIKPRTEAYKRKSFVGLLETNIDFTETDLDVVIREKTKEISSPNRINVAEIENVDPRSPTTDFLRTPIQIIKKIGEIELNDSEIDTIISNSDINKDKEIKQNIHVEESEVLQFYEDIETQNVTKEINTTPEQVDTTNNSISDGETPVSFIQSAPVTPPPNSVVLSVIGSKSVPVTPPLVNLTADVRELDKKLTDLIYEDRDIVVCPRIVKLKDVTERSPLRNRNVIEPDKKINHKLKVSDKPRKSEFAVSKIPVYRQKPKDKIKKSNIQCENTPPRCIEKKKISRKSHWDNTDTTLYL